MSRRQPKVEILPAVRDRSLPASVEKAVGQLVEQKVSEALGQHGILEPWFRSREEAATIRRGLTVPEKRRWAVFFERYGCLHCHKNDRMHSGNGLCHSCRPAIEQKLRRIVKELSGGGEA